MQSIIEVNILKGYIQLKEESIVADLDTTDATTRAAKSFYADDTDRADENINFRFNAMKTAPSTPKAIYENDRT